MSTESAVGAFGPAASRPCRARQIVRPLTPSNNAGGLVRWPPAWTAMKYFPGENGFPQVARARNINDTAARDRVEWRHHAVRLLSAL
jgi:hypothetical protein